MAVGELILATSWRPPILGCIMEEDVINGSYVVFWLEEGIQPISTENSRSIQRYRQAYRQWQLENQLR